MKAVAADLHMPAQRGGPARLDGPHQTQLMVRQRMECAVPLAVGAEDIGHLDGWPRHRPYPVDSVVTFFLGRPGLGRLAGWSSGLTILATVCGETVM